MHRLSTPVLPDQAMCRWPFQCPLGMGAVQVPGEWLQSFQECHCCKWSQPHKEGKPSAPLTSLRGELWECGALRF